MQPVDFTTLAAACHELRSRWLPARCEQVYQRDRFTLCVALRTLEQRGWLTLSWHPQAARLHMGPPPPRQPDTFTFSQQLKHQLNGLALTQIEPIAPWERAFDLQFARRPDEPALWHLYVEVMGKYSNVILTQADQRIVTAAHQVSEQQSSVRPIQTGRLYQPPPPIAGRLPRLEEAFDDWQDRVSLIPGRLKKMLAKAYSGLSSAIVSQIIQAAKLDPDQSTDSLSPADWQRLYDCWQSWLYRLRDRDFTPGWRETGYTVMGWGLQTPAPDVQTLLQQYYRQQLNQEAFSRLHHQLSQKLKNQLAKLRQKADTFAQRLHQSDAAEAYRQKADLLMAHLQDWQPGMQSLVLADFETGEPVTLQLNPEKNAVQNAQALYKQHQKLKRARLAVAPLLAEVTAEVRYLEQVEAALWQSAVYETEADLEALEEMRDELVQQDYLADSRDAGRAAKADSASQFHRYRTPDGVELLVGRNNRQNEELTFKQATDYDLWLHTQEIPGSHVLLRLDPGAVASDQTLQFAADFAAYYSRAHQADQVPVVYTEPKHVYKPKGAHPGMVIYRQERVLWGQPQRALAYLQQSAVQDSAQPSLV
ncbi:NFACT family protein [Romeria aff. gracilis LEGE 07310]|uniref:Rqc2 homolog RqcH n=1 Tax=Vasconcelosia minhoensis LEGE 07310 TaxID=915328 RepID=A0A8J7DL50_9CYAN|nr:NFACT family protein [Romeria gracilis]MBE9076986.1 NFACT family protein [Romeria aff. gracilis LEGE 07310]